MYPHLFRDLVVRDTDSIVPYTLGLQVHADYFVPHRHHFIEFSYVIQGEGTETVDGHVHPLRPGTFSLLLPSQVHTLHASADKPISLYVGGLDVGNLSHRIPLLDSVERMLLQAQDNLPSHVHFSGEEAASMEILFKEMAVHLQEQDGWAEAMFIARLTEALSRFDKARRPRNIALETPAPAMPTRGDFRQIVQYVRTHSNEPLSLRHLAGQFHRSEASISAGFKRLMGGSYLDFLHELRVRDACALLRASSLSVTEVAVEVGYESYETFARVFRQRKGMSATAWRKRVSGAVATIQS